jgi:hypothetical protein
VDLPDKPLLGERFEIAPYGHVGNAQLLYELAHSHTAVRLHTFGDCPLALRRQWLRALTGHYWSSSRWAKTHGVIA